MYTATDHNLHNPVIAETRLRIGIQIIDYRLLLCSEHLTGIDRKASRRTRSVDSVKQVRRLRLKEVIRAWLQATKLVIASVTGHRNTTLRCAIVQVGRCIDQTPVTISQFNAHTHQIGVIVGSGTVAQLVQIRWQHTTGREDHWPILEDIAGNRYRWYLAEVRIRYFLPTLNDDVGYQIFCRSISVIRWRHLATMEIVHWLDLSYGIFTGWQVIKFVIATGIRGRRANHVAQLIQQLDRYAGKRIFIWISDTILVQVNPYFARDTTGNELTEVVATTFRVTAEHDVDHAIALVKFSTYGPVNFANFILAVDVTRGSKLDERVLSRAHIGEAVVPLAISTSFVDQSSVGI